MSRKEMCLLLDSWSKPLANGFLIGAMDADMLQVQVQGEQMDLITDHEIIQVLSSDHDDRAVKCRLVRSRHDMIVLERLEIMDSVQRQNLRIPVCFNSYLYPVGKSAGRMEIRSVDLSCGGIAFYGTPGIEVEEIVEVVVPITEQPLVVRAKILRTNDLKNGKTLYAAKFVELCHDEEKMIRRAVFGIQIRNERS